MSHDFANKVYFVRFCMKLSVKKMSIQLFPVSCIFCLISTVKVKGVVSMNARSLSDSLLLGRFVVFAFHSQYYYIHVCMYIFFVSSNSNIGKFQLTLVSLFLFQKFHYRFY